MKVKVLAKLLDIKEPSVVEMLQKLKKKGLVIYERSRIILTKAGREQAIKIVRRHELAERLLSDVFKHDLPGVHEHACEFEHILDDELADGIDRMLGKPSECPHGYPIPTPKGRVTELKGERLTELGVNEECIVMTIPEERGLVERLLSLNILPGRKIVVIEKLPRSAMVLQCGETRIALSRNIASKILVKRHPTKRSS